MMEGSDLINVETTEDGGNESEDFFSQDFVAQQSNSSSSISQDAFIQNAEPEIGQI